MVFRYQPKGRVKQGTPLFYRTTPLLEPRDACQGCPRSDVTNESLNFAPPLGDDFPPTPRSEISSTSTGFLTSVPLEVPVMQIPQINSRL